MWKTRLYVLAGLLLAGPGQSQRLPGVPSPLVAGAAGGSILLGGTTQGGDLTPTPGVVQAAVPACAAAAAPCSHGWLAKIAPSGDAVEWATYLPAGAPDSVDALVVAADGSVYAAGWRTAVSGRRLSVARLSADGRSILATIQFGGSGLDSVRKLLLDADGNVYLAGTTASLDFPTTAGAYQRAPGTAIATGGPVLCKGDADGFAMKFDGWLRNILLSTRIGTAAEERLDDFALGPDGSLYLAATLLPERDSPCSGTLLTRLTPEGGTAAYSVLWGGSGGGYAVAVDWTGAAYVGSDNRLFGLATPGGTILKVNAQGGVVGRTNIDGRILALSAEGGTIRVAGSSWPGILPLTPDGPAACYPSIHYERTSVPFVATLDAASLAKTHMGYLTAQRIWMIGADRVVAALPYSTNTPYRLLPAGPPDPGTVTCIADAADYQANAVAPGEIVSLFGNRIGPDVPAMARPNGQGNIDTELAGVRVQANGLPAPLLYAGSGQINVVLPFGIRGGEVHLEVYRDGIQLDRFTKLLVERHAGAFATGTPLIGPLAALNQDGSVNGPSNPARAGSIISIFVTGLGIMSPQLPDGAVAAGTANVPVRPVEVLVNGQTAETLYIGNAPTLVQGVVQINLRLPNPIPEASGAVSGRAYVGIAAPAGAGADSGGTVAVQ